MKISYLSLTLSKSMNLQFKKKKIKNFTMNFGPQHPAAESNLSIFSYIRKWRKAIMIIQVIKDRKSSD